MNLNIFKNNQPHTSKLSCNYLLIEVLAGKFDFFFLVQTKNYNTHKFDFHIY